MQLTKHTDYAFRILIYLASADQNRITIQDIASTYQLPKTHLMKIVNKMHSLGWVQATRGRNGGISLAIKPNQLSLKTVVESMEQTLNPINCETPLCLLQGGCLLKQFLLEGQQAYLDSLGRYTIEDIISDDTVLRITNQTSALTQPAD